LLRRTVINRAYYAAFHSARDALRGHGLTNVETRFHRQVWHQYLTAERAPEHSVDTWRGIADLGLWLQEERLRADYDAAARWSGPQCRAVVQRAHMLVSQADTLLAAPTR
jgi:uncharacterized protein (UPF0332 family)